MSIEDVRGREADAAVRRIGGRRPVALLLLLGATLLAACGGDTADTSLEETTSAVTREEQPEAPVPAMEEPATIADLFPEGEGRQIVLNNCASCHAVACTVIGQRSEGRWQDLEAAHREHVPSLSDEDRQLAFAYLRENFGADSPEPNVPPQFLEGGCTPF